MLQVSSTKNRNRTEQIIAGAQGFNDREFNFIWAGDIDGDGLLDLIMDMSSHYNVMRYTLFLSSQAEKGEIFKRVEEFKTVGGCALRLLILKKTSTFKPKMEDKKPAFFEIILFCNFFKYGYQFVLSKELQQNEI